MLQKDERMRIWRWNCGISIRPSNLLEDKNLELSDDGETDQKLQFDDEMGRLAKAFNSAMNDGSTERILAEYFETRERCEDIINRSSNTSFREHFTEVVAGEKKYTNPSRRFGVLANTFASLRFSICLRCLYSSFGRIDPSLIFGASTHLGSTASFDFK